MKSHELSLIRTEGIEKDHVECMVYCDSNKYCSTYLNCQPFIQVYLPLAGILGLELYESGLKFGEIFIDLANLENDGLQWLPVHPNDQGHVDELPEEVPSPRILISLSCSRSKIPDLPVGLLTNSLNSSNACEVKGKTMEFKIKITENSVEANEESIKIKEIEKKNEVEENRHEVIEELEDSLRENHDILNSSQEIIKSSPIFENLDNFYLQPCDNEDITGKKNCSSEQYLNFSLVSLANILNSDEIFEKSSAIFNENVENTLVTYPIFSNFYENSAETQKNNETSLQSFNVFNHINKTINPDDKLNSLQSKLEKKSSEDKEKTQLISKMKTLIEEKDKDHEDSLEMLKNQINKLSKKLHQSNKFLREANHSNLILTQQLKSLKIYSKCSEPTTLTVVSEKSTQTINDSGINQTNEELLKSVKSYTDKYNTLSREFSFLKEKSVTQEFYIQELLIQNQDTLAKYQELYKKHEITQELLEKQHESLIKNSLTFDETDEKLNLTYPEFYKNSIKIASGFYLYNRLKFEVNDTSETLKFSLNGKEVKIIEFLDKSPEAYEKKTSLEDISNKFETYKPANLIHSRVNSRDNKLKVLTKQW